MAYFVLICYSHSISSPSLTLPIQIPPCLAEVTTTAHRDTGRGKSAAQHQQEAAQRTGGRDPTWNRSRWSRCSAEGTASSATALATADRRSRPYSRRVDRTRWSWARRAPADDRDLSRPSQIFSPPTAQSSETSPLSVISELEPLRTGNIHVRSSAEQSQRKCLATFIIKRGLTDVVIITTIIIQLV